jgi:peroxiredoxin
MNEDKNMDKLRWVSDIELEPLEDVDAQFLLMAQGALFRNTTLPSGAVTPSEYMVAKKGVLVKAPAPVYPDCQDCNMPYYNCLCSHDDDESC